MGGRESEREQEQEREREKGREGEGERKRESTHMHACIDEIDRVSIHMKYTFCLHFFLPMHHFQFMDEGMRQNHNVST